MSIIVLDSTTKSLKVNLSGAVANTNPSFVVTFADTTATAFTEASSDGVLNGTSNVTVVAAPAIATRRVIKNLIIKNNDTAAVTVNLFLDNNGTSRNIARVTLAVDDTWTLSGTFSSNGSLKQTLGTNNLDLTGTTSAQALTVSGATTLSAGTANGILYLNGSKVATSGSALTFNGTYLNANGLRIAGTDTSNTIYQATGALVITADNSFLGLQANSGNPIIFYNNSTERMRLDSSGNLGLGVTPSAWTSYRALQINGLSAFSAGGNDMAVGSNVYYDGSYRYRTTDSATMYIQFARQHQWHNAPSGTAGNAISFTQAMTLNASGDLGLGTTSPSCRLHVYGANPVLRVEGDGGSYYPEIRLDGVNGTMFFTTYYGPTITAASTSGTSPLTFRTGGTVSGGAYGGTERARITSGGYFKASNSGTYLDSTGTYHEIRQTNNSTGVVIAATNASFDTVNVQVDVTRNTTNNSFYPIGYYNRGAGAWRFYVADSGNVTNTNNSYGAISDVKTKQDIVDATSQWDDLKGLKVRKFRYKNDPTAPLQIGLVAQEAETVSPGLIDEHPDYEEVEVTDEEGNVKTERQLTGTSTKSIKYSVLYMKAIKALQEAMARIETLEAKVAALEGTQP